MPDSLTQPRPQARRGRKAGSPRVPQDAGSVLAPYEVRDRDDVLSYLAENPDLLPVLADAPDRIRGVFGASAHIAVEIMRYFDGLPGNRDMWIKIPVPPDVDEAIARLHVLDSTWTVHLPRPLRNKVNVDVEFR